MSDLNTDEVKKVANLALIAVTDEQASALKADIEPVLGYFDVLSSVDTDHIDNVGHITGRENVLRSDKVDAMSSDDRKLMMEAVPVSDGERIVVKGVL
jgi:aspartyl-tRNA(Asn)/glutamyl-tRNA(Gln) amidotransferase subunit C